MRLLLTHPELPSCEDCQQWIYDPAKDWKRTERGGQPCKRPAGMVPPCHKCPKIPKGERAHPSNAVELSWENYLAYVHYLKCKAVGRFPEDPTVERNAGYVRMIEDQVEADDRERLYGLLGDVMRVQAVMQRTR